MCPGHYKKAQGVVIKYVHAIVFHSCGNASAGLAPFDQAIPSTVVSINHGKKGLFASVS